jgi:hypothetical protein
MRYFIVTVLCFTAAIITAQKQAKVSLGKSENSFRSADFYVSKVVDARISKESIGVVQRGLNNRKDPINFINPFETEVYGYFLSLLPSDESKRAIIAIVHNLWVSEKTTMTSELGMADVVIEFVSADNEDVSLGTYTSHNENKGLDVTNGHSRRLRKAIFDCVVQFKKGDNLDDNSSVVRLDFTNGIPSNLNKGLYRSYIDLVNNTPKDYTNEVKLTSKKIEKHIIRYQIRKDRNNGKRFKDYAYYSGKALLLNSSNTSVGAAYYLRNLTEGRYLVYIDRYVKPVTAGAFGAIGAAAGVRKYISILDMSTGIISEMDNDEIVNLLSVSEKWSKIFEASPQKMDDIIEAIQGLNDEIAEQK